MAVKLSKGSVRISGNSHDWKTIQLGEFQECLNEHLDADPLTRFIEGVAKSYVRRKFPQDETHFLTRIICAWGGLRGRNGMLIYEGNAPDNFGKLTRALRAARSESIRGNYKAAMTALSDIKGTGISFRSKFLKFLCPDHAVVLDSKISKELRYSRSAAGYESFVRDCASIRDHLNNSNISRDGNAPWRVSDVEMAIFIKVK